MEAAEVGDLVELFSEDIFCEVVLDAEFCADDARDAVVGCLGFCGGDFDSGCAHGWKRFTVRGRVGRGR